jgi:hypothetical protein
MTFTKTIYHTLSTVTIATSSEYGSTACTWIDMSEAVLAEAQCQVVYSTLGTTGAICKIYSLDTSSPFTSTTASYSAVDQFTLPFASSSIMRIMNKPFIPSGKWMTGTIYNPDTTSITYATVKLIVQKST